MAGDRYYSSPRWSGEITDCSMPMTFDTYSNCSYNCAYCFSSYQRGIGGAKESYLSKSVRAVSVEAVKRIFQHPESSQFGEYIKQKKVMQWGGLSDQFDEFERSRGVTLELLRFFREIEYPICFSTKAAWWTSDERYIDAFRDYKWFNVKFSIITLDADKSKAVERGCPSPLERLAAMERAAKFVGGGVTLRLRPFIIGITNPSFKDLIRAAHNAGATAVSTEFFCMEQRSPRGTNECYPIISQACGFDVVGFYKRNSYSSGYLRLNRNIKRPYIDEMQALCNELGMRFYVSDAHFKERCANGSCCGLPPEWNYSRGQDCEALMLARERGFVTWSDISTDLGFAEGFLAGRAQGFNFNTTEKRAAFYGFSMKDYLRYIWNHPKQGQSPYMMFEGILTPSRIDENGDVVYEWNPQRA